MSPLLKNQCSEYDYLPHCSSYRFLVSKRLPRRIPLCRVTERWNGLFGRFHFDGRRTSARFWCIRPVGGHESQVWMLGQSKTATPSAPLCKVCKREERDWSKFRSFHRKREEPLAMSDRGGVKGLSIQKACVKFTRQRRIETNSINIEQDYRYKSTNSQSRETTGNRAGPALQNYSLSSPPSTSISSSAALLNRPRRALPAGAAVAGAVKPGSATGSSSSGASSPAPAPP